MRTTLRTSTALVASLSIAMGHVPVAAIGQDLDLGQCADGETEDECLARLLEETEAAEDVDTAGDAAAADVPPAEETAPASDVEAADPDAVEEPVAEQAPAATAQEASPETAETPPETPDTAEDAALQAPVEAPEQEAGADTPEVPPEEIGTEAEGEATVEMPVVVDEAAPEAPAEQPEQEAEAQAEESASDTAAEEGGADTTDDATAASSETSVEEPEPETATEDTPPVTVETEDTTAADTSDGTATDPEATPPEAPADEASLAEALAESDEIETVVVAPEELSEADAAALEAARQAAEAAEAAAAAPVDPVAEAEAEISRAESEAAEAQRSLALREEAAPVVAAVEEVITEETSRQPDQDFGQLMTAANEEADGDDVNGLTGVQGLLLGGAAGLVIGSIISGNREVVNRADDRIVVLRPEGDYQVIRDDDALLRRPGNRVMTETFADGSTRNVITQPDGTDVITVRDRDLRILRRTVVAPDGTRTVLIDDIAVQTPVEVSELPQVRPETALVTAGSDADATALARALEAQAAIDRGFSLAQIRSIRAVRDLAPALNLESVTFETGSAAISPDQASQLLGLGRYMSDAIARNPREMFLIEGHTDATGSASFNLALSDRRAETVALALTQYFGVPPQNMVIQGYGEEFLLIPTLENERLNRRVAVRRITDLLQVAAAQ